MKLCVVIATFNRAGPLQLCLDALSQQDGNDFEVVVAVDGSTDDTLRILEERSKHSSYRLKWVNTHLPKRYGLARARNLGILASTAEAVVIIDDDSIPDTDFVKSHLALVSSKTLTGGFRGSTDPDSPLHAKMKRFMHLSELGPVSFTEMTRITGHTLAVENNTCMYRSDWIDSGLFNERIRGYGGIGQEFNKRLDYFGYSYQFNPEARIIHRSDFESDNGLTRRRKNLMYAWNRKVIKLFLSSKRFEAQRRWAREQSLRHLGSFGE